MSLQVPVSKVNFLFLKENEDKQQISGVHPGPRPPVEHSQGTILVSLLFFCASLAISVLVLPFNNSLKSESSGALRCDWQAGSLESNHCCWHRENHPTQAHCQVEPGRGFFPPLWKEHRLNLSGVWGRNSNVKNTFNWKFSSSSERPPINHKGLVSQFKKKLKLHNFTITNWLKKLLQMCKMSAHSSSSTF